MLVLFLASCQPFGPRVQSGFSADRNLLENGASNQLDLVNDVPVPEGSVLDTQLSLVLGRGGRWTGRLVLRVNIPPAQTSSIYLNEMPAFGWNPLFSIQEGFGLSTFERGDRVASVRVEPLGLRGSRVSITVALKSLTSDQGGDIFNTAPGRGSSITPGIGN